MNNSNNSYRNCTHKYEHYLSPFGQKVLGNLIKHLEARNNSNRPVNPVRHNFAQNKRILTFGDSYISTTTINEDNEFDNPTSNNTNNINYLNIESQNAGSKEDNLSIIPTSEGLLKGVVSNENTRNNKLISPNVNTVNLDTDRDASDITRIGERRTITNLDSNYEKDAEKQIEWTDMFDADFLLDLNILGSHGDDTLQEDINNCIIESTNTKEYVVENRSSEIEVPKNVDMIKIAKTTRSHKNRIVDGKNICDTDISTIKANKHLTIPYKITDNSTFAEAHNGEKKLKIIQNGDIVKGTKRKRRNSTTITDTLTKIKKSAPEQPKTSFRKQKYTKVVKNWLNDVNASHHEHVADNILELAQNEEQTNKCETKAKVTGTKKVVQAQLKNKGGVMKFGKPTKDLEIVNAEGAVKQSVDKTTKDKKGKPKFVAPIKSQLPVRDISYTINDINDGNWNQYESVLGVIEKDEVAMILIFSNGFCQLNSHYTEETCVVEGVMFQIHDVIYYWKSADKGFSDTAKKIVTNNSLICYDGKNVLKFFATQHDLCLESTKISILDTQIGGNLVDPDNPPENFSGLQKLLSFEPQYTIATDCVLQKSAWYLTMMGESFTKLRDLLVENELWKVFVDIEMRVLPIITDMEIRGVHVDLEKLNIMENILLTRMKSIELACHESAGKTFQINSTLQVRNILYEELQLDAKCNVKIRETVCKGEKSTSESMLRSLADVHPLPKLILEYRHLHKAHATFLAGIAHQVKDGVVKPTWVQTAAATGRIASNNPNLQAIPKAPFSLVLFPGDGERSESSSEISLLNFRSVYIPREGYILLAADFKHIECRVFAYAAADTSLLDALSSPDLFAVLAARWLNKPEDAVSPADRERTKRIVYASLYGAGARKLAEILGVSYDQALSVVSSFNRTFPSLKQFGRTVVARAAGGGRLCAASGRTRRFPHIGSADHALRSHAERQAVNFIVQGSAADLCKMAMVLTEERLRSTDPPLCCRLLLQIHDELVWEVSREDLDPAAVTIKSVMESVGQACGMALPLPVAVSAGPSWGHMEPYTPQAHTSDGHVI